MRWRDVTCACRRASFTEEKKSKTQPAGRVARLRRLMLVASEATTHIESLALVSQETRTRPHHHDDGGAGFEPGSPTGLKVELLVLRVSCGQLAHVSQLGPQKQPPLLRLQPATCVVPPHTSARDPRMRNKAGKIRKPPSFYLFRAPVHVAAPEMLPG